jgi:hypothetical protein
MTMKTKPWTAGGQGGSELKLLMDYGSNRVWVWQQLLEEGDEIDRGLGGLVQHMMHALVEKGATV